MVTLARDALEAKADHYRGIDLSGARFHDAIVKERAHNNPKDWLVVCTKCGRGYFLSISGLVRGKPCPNCKHEEQHD